MTSKHIWQKYLAFFKQKGHCEIPNLSLVPEGDSTLLFVNSGMFPLVPYLSGESHPLGKRLVNIQRSMRFEDIEEVGDNRHTTAFHMLGNWSLGDYFKKEQLAWIYQFLIEEVGLDPQRLFASVFLGDQDASKDTESIMILEDVFKKYGIAAKENERIFAYGKQENWWQRGDAIGELGGPDSEIFYYLGKNSGLGKNPATNQAEFIEIGNSVFMQYRKTESGWKELSQKNVDFGGGLERIALAAQNKQDVFETDNFISIVRTIEQKSQKQYDRNEKTTRSMRILADHARTATLLAMDGVLPSNKDQGYILRRYLRRIVRFGNKIGLENSISHILPAVIKSLNWLYPELGKQKPLITKLFQEEQGKFSKTLQRAQKQVKQAIGKIDSQANNLAKIAFDLYQSTGYPPELFLEEAQDQGIKVSLKRFEKDYQNVFQTHQQVSRKGAEQKFKGGLADHSNQVLKYHTATHLLHQALRVVLGSEVQQYGSNITGERLRFDFSYSSALTEQQVKKTEDLINQTITQKLPVKFVMLKKEKAEKAGVLHFFKEKYPDQVKVYYIGETLDSAFSKEFCGGPHVQNLSELPPNLSIYKQKAVAKGIRRIYAQFAKQT